jgi:hypothetical protein
MPTSTFFQLPTTSGNTGPKIEGTEVVEGSDTKFRQTVRIAGSSLTDLVGVTSSGLNIYDITPLVGVETTDNTAVVTQNTKTIANGTTPLTPKFAVISRNTSTDGAAVVNLVAAKKIRVLRYTFLNGTIANNVQWQSSTSDATGGSSNTNLTGLLPFSSNAGIVEGFCPVGIFETVAGQSLKLNMSSTGPVMGNLTYVEV